MDDLECIGETFTVLGRCIERDYEDSRGDTHGLLTSLFDPHDAADAWISASSAERVELARKAAEYHAAVIRMHAENLRREARLSPAMVAAKAAAYGRWRREQKPDVVRAENAAWRAKNRDYLRLKASERRAELAKNPEKLAAERLRDALRRKQRALELHGPRKPAQTREERLASKREQSRRYRETHPAKPRAYTEEQLQYRRDYYRAKYHEAKKDDSEYEGRKPERRYVVDQDPPMAPIPDC